MKRRILCAGLAAVLLLITACTAPKQQPNIAATTMPVFTFTQALCNDTPLSVGLLVQENVSCLHDYTLTVRHMKTLESADLIIISGGGLEGFLEDALPHEKTVVDSSSGITQHCADEAHHNDHDHHHGADPHFWLSIKSARQMAHNIYQALRTKYPQYAKEFDRNWTTLSKSFDDLQQYAHSQLSNLSCKEIVTFHDGFSYMAEEFDLTILYAVEEESGSEASAKDLIAVCDLVTQHTLPAIFVEKNGSDSAAQIICSETGCKLYALDMAMSGNNYFDAMYHNINTLKEALG